MPTVSVAVRHSIPGLWEKLDYIEEVVTQARDCLYLEGTTRFAE